MTSAVRAVGVQPNPLVSGAGHDAGIMAAVAPVTMLFVRCAGGVSHHPDESVSEADVTLAVDALRRFVELLAAQHSESGEGER
jgi:allantoate deiminase